MAIYVGMANWIGACYMVRCSECHHLTFASANQPQASCAHCRHPMLLHPLYATQHPGHAVRVVEDRLAVLALAATRVVRHRVVPELDAR